MAGGQREKFDNPVVEWVDSRLPVFTLMQKEYGVFPTPRNFNYFWNFGAIAMFMLVTMIVTGITLAMQYTADTTLAFNSVEGIMRDVNYGWLIRYIHMNGASFFFIAVYIHIFRGMYYGSYKQPRELLWILGVVIFLLMMATAFMGYVLPWGQMSYWGATVITNLFSAIPLVGDDIVTLLWGGFSVDNPTLKRFFALHYLLPFVIFAVVFLHVWALHVTGSNNPTGVEPKGKQDTLPFHPYYTMKDTFGLIVFVIIYAAFVFFMPNALGHPDNYIPADPLVTPAHIVPEWYFLPFYAILRAITFDIGIPFTDIALIEAKLGGVIAMFGAIVLLLIMPWLDTHPVRSARYRPLYKKALLVFVFGVVVLGYAGSQPADKVYWQTCIGSEAACSASDDHHGAATDTAHTGDDHAKPEKAPMVLKFDNTMLAQIFTIYYYVFFLVILPLLSRKEKALPIPKSIHEAVLAKAKASAAK
ncbi:MAG: cytochrome b/b6 [Pseudomonadota bacterium]|jgi:ubiquinol-cytochrome c reductase cytochrome b subunit|nr:cytochrome b/b6 [Pseudomonadota bacterium]